MQREGERELCLNSSIMYCACEIYPPKIHLKTKRTAEFSMCFAFSPDEKVAIVMDWLAWFVEGDILVAFSPAHVSFLKRFYTIVTV